MKVVADGLEFHFTDALDAFVFDETDTTKETFHGAPMKAVDIVADFKECHVYVELKRFANPSGHNASLAANDNEKAARVKRFGELKEALKYKFRDSLLYRYAERKTNKPAHYICLINFDAAQSLTLQKSLEKELPVGKASPRWEKALAESCHVVNMDMWNKHFPKWPVTLMPVIA